MEFSLTRKNMKVLVGIIVLLGILISQLLNSSQTSKNLVPSPTSTKKESTLSAQLFKVLNAVDGDTIVIEGNQTVRYIGIDTPETKHPQKGVECYGKEAKKKNEELVEGKMVKLEKDVSESDKYGRLLRYVYLVNESSPSSSLFVNEYLVREGFANASTYPPDVKFSELFLEAQNEAREKNKGLWSECVK